MTQSGFVAICQAGIATNFDILRRLEINHQVAPPHRFDQRRMRAANFRRVDIGEAPGPQFAVSQPVDGPWRDDPGIPGIADARDVFDGMGRIPNQRELH